MPPQRNSWDPVAWQGRRRHRRPRSSPRFQRTFNLGFTLRLVAFCLFWVALLIWPAPQLSVYISTHGLVNAKGLFSHVAPTNHSTPTPANTTQLQLWQVGLAADLSNESSTGARSTIETRLPQQVSKNTTNYFWVGAYLRDNSFIQVGYYIPWFDSNHAGWFYCTFYANGRTGPCVNGPLGSAGPNGTRHTYTIESIGKVNGSATWHVFLDTALIGQFNWAYGDTGQNVPVIYAESSGYAPHLSTSRLGPVDFVSGLEVRHMDASSYQPVAHLTVIYNSPAVCPPYGISSDGHGGILLGSGLPCPALYDQLV